jgi:hypothetical protein
MAIEKLDDERFCQRADLSKEHHQLRPRSLRTSGAELDEACSEGSPSFFDGINSPSFTVREKEEPEENDGESEKESNPTKRAMDRVTYPPGRRAAKLAGSFVDWRATKIGRR